MAQLATVPQKVRETQALIERIKPQIADMLPKHITPDRMVRLARAMVSNNPRLAECTTLSLVTSLAECSLLGLEPNTPLGYCWILPFRNSRSNCTEAKLIAGYKGYIELFYRTGGVVSAVNADVVYTNDQFRYRLGTNSMLDHVYAEGERGELKGAWAAAKVNGEWVFKYMPKAEILKHKAASRGAQQGGNDCPWNNQWEPEMWKKTAILSLADILPKSREIAELQAVDRQDQGHDTGPLLIDTLVQEDELPQLPAGPPASAPSAPAAPSATSATAANRRPGRPPKNPAPAAPAPQAAPPPPAEKPQPPVDEPPSDAPADDDLPDDDLPDDSATSSANEDAKVRAELLAKIEADRLAITDIKRVAGVMGSFGLEGVHELEGITDISVLANLSRAMQEAAEIDAQERKTKEASAQAPAGGIIESSLEEIIKTISPSIRENKIPGGGVYKIGAVKVRSFSQAMTKEKKSIRTKLQIFNGPWALDCLFMEAPPQWLQNNMNVDIVALEARMHNGGLFWVVNDWKPVL